jgi:D-cysteine desulfhydrase
VATPYAIELRRNSFQFASIRQMNDCLASAYPHLAEHLPKTRLADLPTPLIERTIKTAKGNRRVAIKCDDRTAELYGGNKVRKLEYLLYRASERKAQRIATFGTVASNHALATALFSKSLGFGCICLLSHQARTRNAPRVLNMHLQNGTKIVHYGGSYANRVHTLRTHLWSRQTWVIPAGGSSWLGAVGFVNAGLEVADQVASGIILPPDRLYVANGTMATAAGLALGLALAGLTTEVQAIRVTHESIANPRAMRRLLVKTATLLNRLDPAIPADLADRSRLCFRDDFFGAGYAHSNSATDRAIDVARDELGLTLEATYTGKAMAAMLHDLAQGAHSQQSMLFWNTYNSRPLPVSTERPADVSRLPEEFLRYLD